MRHSKTLYCPLGLAKVKMFCFDFSHYFCMARQALPLCLCVSPSMPLPWVTVQPLNVFGGSNLAKRILSQSVNVSPKYTTVLM